jgi:hypothetical protein
MSDIFTREEIERSITEHIRQRAIALGYLPDVTLFVGNMAGYQAARAAIITGGKELIDIFGIGSADNRGEKTYHRIFLNLRQYNNGSVTHAGDSGYVETSPGVYDRQVVNASMKTIIYDLRTVTAGVNATEYDRICLDLIMASLTTSSAGYGLPALKADMTFDLNKRMNIRYTGSNEIKGTDFFERQITFEVFDVWLNGSSGSVPWGTSIPTAGILPIDRIIGNGGIEGEPPQTIIDVE